MKTRIIAEAGVNHNGDMNLARKLIDAAADAGADMVKFQTFKAETLVTIDAGKANYQVQATDEDESQHEMLQKLELSRDMHEDLIEHCSQCGIEFFSTGFDPESIDLLASLGLDRFKIPSGEITNLPYLRHIGGYAKPIILSTGMASLAEVEAALVVLEKAGTSRDTITVLQCNTAYPTPMADVNLLAMRTMGDELGVSVGYSDHTLGIEASIAAVAMGATIIEKHFTLDRDLPGPDHKASLEPNELTDLVTAIRNIELAHGDGVKRPSPSETENIPVARKSIVAATAIRAGDVFTAANLTVKRPGTGLSPMSWDEVLGQKAERDFAPDEFIVL